MEKKGLKSVIFCISVLLFLFSLSAFALADVCFDPGLGKCLTDVSLAVCTSANVNGTFYAGKQINEVEACQLTGCCCYKQSGTNMSVPTVSSAACFKISPTAQFVAIAGGIGYDVDSAMGSCSVVCSQIGSLQSGVNGTNSTTTYLNLTPANLSDNTKVNIQTLDDCHSTITGTVTSEYGLPNGLLVFSQNNRATSWGIVQSSGGNTGTFVIDGVCAGSNTITASDSTDQFVSNSQSRTVPQDQTVSGVVLTLTPARLGTITGTVVNADTNAKLSGIFVRVKETTYAATTNGQGQFTITIPNIAADAQNYILLASSSADATNKFISTSKIVTLSDSQRTATTTISMTPQTCFGNEAPSSLSVIHVKGVPHVTLTWSMTACEDEVNSYAVYRCEGRANQCNNDAQFFVVDYANTKSFTDTTLDWDTYYTYRIGAVYAGQIVEISDRELEVNSGNAACAGVLTTNEFCGVESKNGAFIDAKQYCDKDNLFESEVCDVATPVCVIRSADVVTRTAQCIQPNPCAQSSTTNPFGLYSSQSACSSQQFGGVCYLDKGTSNVDACLNCRQGMTCTDYKSESACTNDANSCNVGSCAWQTIDPLLGIGVCKSTKVASCNDCTNESKSPFGVCDARTCGAFGSAVDGCFFKSTPTLTTCQACSATQCSEYTTANACEGSPRASTGLNATTNAFISKSNDACNIDVCRWKVDADLPAGGACIKDADANTVDDCAGSWMDSAKCNLDRTAPSTFVVMPSVSNPFLNNVSIRFLPQDKGAVGSLQVFATRFCITSEENKDIECTEARNFAVAQRAGAVGIYLNITNGVINLPGDDANAIAPYTYSFSSEGGIYYLKYYSIDHAKNLETVVTKQFIINTTPPDITLNVSQFVKPGQTRETSIIASATSEVPVRCLITVVPLGQATYAPDAFTTSTPKAYTLFHEYTFDKEDGVYAVKATCRDVSGNANYEIEEIVASADPRIQNIKPSGLIGTPTPTVTLQTTMPVQCKMTADRSKLNNTLGADTAFSSLEFPLVTTGVRGPGGLYNHSASLSGLTEGTHTYYIMCNFNPYSYDIASFTVDTQAPTVNFESAIVGTPFDFSVWHQNPVLYVSCSKSSNFQLPCSSIEYCTSPAVFANAQGQAQGQLPVCDFKDNSFTITKNIPRREIPIHNADDYSMIVCARAVEVLSGGEERVSTPACRTLLIDKVNPQLDSGALPTITNRNQLSLNGFIFDPVVYDKTVTFPQTKGSSTVGFYDTKIVAANLFLNGTMTLVSELSQRSYAQIILRNGSASPVTVQLDMRDTTKAPVLSVLNAAQQTLASVSLPDVRSGVLATWSVLLNETTINVTFANTSVVTTVPASGAGSIEFRAFNLDGGNDNKPKITVTKVSLVDLDIARQYPPSLQVRIDGGSDDRSSTTPTIAYGPFATTVLLANAADLVEGREYQLSVLVRDQSNRDSLIKTGVIKFSTAGPLVQAISFVPVNTSQRDKTYIEFRQNATVKLNTSSGYGLASATVSAFGNMQSLTRVESYGFSNTYDTYDLPVGLLDVTANVTDRAGTSTVVVFERALWVRNLQDPLRNISVEDNVTTNSTTPTFTFNVTDALDVNCSATYTTASGRTQVDRFISSSDPLQSGVLSLTLSEPLPYIDGETTESQVLISCHLNSNPKDKWSRLVRVLVDKRPPVIAVSSPLIDKVVLQSYDRVVKNYLVYAQGSYAINIQADEPVACRISPIAAASPTAFAQPTDVSAYFDAMGVDVVVGDMQERVYSTTSTAFIDAQDMTKTGYAVSCVDRVGNVAKTVRFVTFETNSSAAPAILSVTPTSVTQLSRSVPVVVTTAVPADCTVAVQDQESLLTQSGEPQLLEVISSIDTTGTSQRSYSKTITFPTDGRYDLFVSCTNGAVSAKTTSVVVDTVLPIVNVTPKLAPIMYTQSSHLELTLAASEAVRVQVKSGAFELYDGIAAKGTSTIAIPVSIGITPAQITFSDAAGNSVTTSVQIRRAALGLQTEFVDLSADSVRPAQLFGTDGDNVVAVQLLDATRKPYVLNSSAVVRAQLHRIDFSSSPMPMVPLTIPTAIVTNATSTNLFFDVPAVLADGKYMLIYNVTHEGSLLASDSAVFTIDSLSEQITARQAMAQHRRSTLPISVNVSVPYQNLIVTQESSWNLATRVLTQVYGKAVALLSVPAQQGISTLLYSLVNELGHTSQVRTQITHDVTAPFSAVTFTLDTRNTATGGAVPTSTSPVPGFTLDYAAEPMRLVAAQITRSGVSYDVAMLDAQEQQFYDSIQLRSAQRLDNGQYSLIVTLADVYGNFVSNQKFDFRVQSAPLKITVQSPKFGMTNNNTLPLVVATDRPAQCVYALSGSVAAASFATMDAFLESDGFAHSATLSFTDAVPKYTANYSVSCIENGTLSPVINATFMLGKNTVAPVVESIVIPTVTNGVLANADYADIIVTTDTPAVCRFTTSTLGPSTNLASEYAFMTELGTQNKLELKKTQSLSGLVSGQNYTYTVVCDNGAGVYSAPKATSFVVDETTRDLITIDSPIDGGNYISTAIPIQFTVAFPVAQGCVYATSEAGLTSAPISIPKSTTNSLKYSVTPSSTFFKYGDNRLYIRCTFASGEGNAQLETAQSRFVVDATAPEKGYVKVANVTTKTDRINAEFVFRDNESGISLYEYAVGTAPYGQSGWNATKKITSSTSSRVTISGLKLVDGQIYYVSALAKNGAGKASVWVSSNATRVDVSGSDAEELLIVPVTTSTVSLLDGSTITYTNGSRVTLANGTKIIVPATIADQFKAGAVVTLPAGTILVAADGTRTTVPANARITLPQAVATTTVTTTTRSTTNTTSTTGSSTNNRGNNTASRPPAASKPLDGPGAFGAGLLLFLLTLGLVGGGAGYYFYARKQSRSNRYATAGTSSSYGNSAADDVVVPTGPLTVNDKLKLALQSRIRKQKGAELPGKASHLFSAFDDGKRIGTGLSAGSSSGSLSSASSTPFKPRIGVTKLSGASSAGSSSTGVGSGLTSALQAPSADIDKTLERTQASLDKLKQIAGKQKPISQLRRLQSRSGASDSRSVGDGSSALSRLRSLKKK